MSTLTAERKSSTRTYGADPWESHRSSTHIPDARLQRVIAEAERGINLIGPFATAHEAFLSMMAGADDLEDEDDDYCTP